MLCLAAKGEILDLTDFSQFRAELAGTSLEPGGAFSTFAHDDLEKLDGFVWTNCVQMENECVY